MVMEPSNIRDFNEIEPQENWEPSNLGTQMDHGRSGPLDSLPWWNFPHKPHSWRCNGEVWRLNP